MAKQNDRISAMKNGESVIYRGIVYTKDNTASSGWRNATTGEEVDAPEFGDDAAPAPRRRLAFQGVIRPNPEHPMGVSTEGMRPGRSGSGVELKEEHGISAGGNYEIHRDGEPTGRLAQPDTADVEGVSPDEDSLTGSEARLRAQPTQTVVPGTGPLGEAPEEDEDEDEATPRRSRSKASTKKGKRAAKNAKASEGGE